MKLFHRIDHETCLFESALGHLRTGPLCAVSHTNWVKEGKPTPYVTLGSVQTNYSKEGERSLVFAQPMHTSDAVARSEWWPDPKEVVAGGWILGELKEVKP